MFDAYSYNEIASGDADVEIRRPTDYGSIFADTVRWLERQYSCNPGAIRYDDIKVVVKDHDFGIYYISYQSRFRDNEATFLRVIG